MLLVGSSTGRMLIELCQHAPGGGDTRGMLIGGAAHSLIDQQYMLQVSLAHISTWLLWTWLMGA